MLCTGSRDRVGPKWAWSDLRPFPNFSWSSSSLALSDSSRLSLLKTLFPLMSLLLFTSRWVFEVVVSYFVRCRQPHRKCSVRAGEVSECPPRPLARVVPPIQPHSGKSSVNLTSGTGILFARVTWGTLQDRFIIIKVSSKVFTVEFLKTTKALFETV